MCDPDSGCDYGQVLEEYRGLVESLFLLVLQFADGKSNEIVRLRLQVEEEKQRRNMKTMQKEYENYAEGYERWLNFARLVHWKGGDKPK